MDPNRTLTRSLRPGPGAPGTGRLWPPLAGSGRLPLTWPLSQSLWDKMDGPPVGLMLSQGCRSDVRQEPPPPLWAGAGHPAHCGLWPTVQPSIRPYHYIRDGPFCTNELPTPPHPPPHTPSGMAQHTQSPWWGSEVIVFVTVRYTGSLTQSQHGTGRGCSPSLSRGGNQMPERGLPAGPELSPRCTGSRAPRTPLLLLTEAFREQM